MISNQKNQQGMTFIGLVFMFIFVGMFLLAILRVFPLYYENMAVQTVLENFEVEFSEKPTMSVKAMKAALQTKLDVQDVRSLNSKDIEIKRTKYGYTLDASYNPTANYVSNFYFMVDFDHVIELNKK